ncbi:Ccnh [Vulpes lagopus]
MYHNSSQKRHWTFASEEQLARLRADANRKFKCKAVANGKVLPNDPVFLEPHEEMILCKYYEKRLLEFCSVFKPAMPRSVVGTACMYFKRFYRNNSVMEYHPWIIIYLSESLMLKENRTCLSQLLDIMKSMRNLVKKYEPPRSEEVAALKQKLERCHSAELALNVIMKKRKGYEDDDYVSDVTSQK